MNVDSQGMNYLEPSCTTVLLPACRACGGVHPLARKGDLPADLCPDCGGPAATPGAPSTESAEITGFTISAILARACYAIGRWLFNLAKRI